jgi:hypothetical protein
MKALLAILLRWFASVKWGDFLRVVGAAVKAGELYPKSTVSSKENDAAVNRNRVAHVLNFIAQSIPELTGWKSNLVLELAVGWLNRTKK